MLSIIKEHRKIIYCILCVPILLIATAICTDIIFNIGVYFGTIARHVSEGICCI